MTLLEARSHGSDAWALFFGLPIHAAIEEKIAWRMPGTGQFVVFARDAQGRKINPSTAPVKHLSSKWDHPGEEWGSGVTFPHAGCWTLVASRLNRVGTFVVNVLP
jgi:hypothetical protein